jgi:hypothetical protein
MRLGIVPFFEVYIRILVLLLLFGLAFPGLSSLLGVFPIGLLPGIAFGYSFICLPVWEQPGEPTAVPHQLAGGLNHSNPATYARAP